jgi:hypothetical protein
MSDTFDPHVYHLANITKNNYAASTNFVNSTAWQHNETGLEVVNSDEEPLIAIIVGRALAYRLKCGPEGNHFAKGSSPLEKAKYQFHICRPSNPELAADFTAGIQHLQTLQNEVGKTGDHKNMIVEDVTGKMLRFATNFFMTRVCAQFSNRIEYCLKLSTA